MREIPDLSPLETKERCGFIMQNGSYVEVQNVCATPEEGFEMDPVEALGHLATGQVIATWHSHPKTPPVLSGADRECFLQWPELLHRIFGFYGPELTVRSYEVKDGMVVECS